MAERRWRRELTKRKSISYPMIPQSSRSVLHGQILPQAMCQIPPGYVNNSPSGAPPLPPHRGALAMSPTVILPQIIRGMEFHRLLGNNFSLQTRPRKQQWLLKNRFSSYTRLFSNFSGADLLKLTKEDLVQICGTADGIQLYNSLKSRSGRPRLTIYVCQEQPGSSRLQAVELGMAVGHPLFIIQSTWKKWLPQKLLKSL